MNLRDLPPLSAMRTFTAFSQNGTLARTGEALGVSHAAVSQQISRLEDHLGVALVRRDGRGLMLTSAGRSLSQACLDGFDTMSGAVDEITGASAVRPVHVSCTPTFAAIWLMPRLHEFQALHPDVSLLIDPSPQLVTLGIGGTDVAIRYGTGPWTGLEAQMLIRSPMVVVAAPSLTQGRRIETPGDLAELPWMEELGTTEGTRWLRRHGADGDVMGPRVQAPGNLMLEGARNGQGIAVTVRAFVEDDIAGGRLDALFEEEQEGAGYHICTLPGVMRPGLRAFVRWLGRQAQD